MNKRILFISNHLRGPGGAAGTRSWQQTKVLSETWKVTVVLPEIDPVTSQPITFDHMLNSRRFNSLIYKEENVYEDRKIEEYIFEDALQQLLESERVKSVIRDFEQDLWNN